MPLEAIEARARTLAASLGEAASLLDGLSTIGGGSLPGETLPTVLVSIAHPKPERLAARLRAANPPVVARVEAGRLLVDLRTVLPEQDGMLAGVLREVVTAA